MEIRDSETRRKYLEAKEFIKEYEKMYSKALEVNNKTTWQLYKLREEISYMRKRGKPIYIGLIKSRLNLIKALLKSKYESKE